MKKIIFILIFASLQLKGGNIILNQSEAVLGEPVIIEIGGGEDYFVSDTIYIDGPEIRCIELEKYRDENRINLVEFFKIEGEYEIKILPDPMLCNMIKEIKKEKEELERIEDQREYEILKMKIEDEEKHLEDLKKQKQLWGEKIKFKIKINYPIDFDKYIYENILKGKENLSEFWNRGYYNENLEEIKTFIDEILTHKESNYYPWALYIAINKRLNYSGRSLKSQYENITIDSKGILSKHESEGKINFIKDIIQGIEEVEKKFNEFPFIDELILNKGILLFLFGEEDKELEKTFNYVLKNGKQKETIETARKFLELIKEGEKKENFK